MPTPPHPVRVMIVEDHPLFRAGLENALSQHSDLRVVGVSDDGIQAVDDARVHQPDVVLLDVNLPRRNGLQAMQRLLRDVNPRLAVIILTAHHDDDQVLQAFSGGASAYTTKTIHPDRLVEIVRWVAAGYHVVGTQRMMRDEFDDWLRGALLRKHAGAAADATSALSAREMEILTHVTGGMLNKEIAQSLGISQQTVKNHVTAILRKLNVKDRTQAAVTALRRGWVKLNQEEQE